MAKVQIFFCPMFKVMTSEKDLPTIKENLDAGLFTSSGTFEVAGEGEEAAEEVFELTNNPYWQDEREEVYGRGRSLSSGDVVEVDGKEQWACLSFGWGKL